MASFELNIPGPTELRDQISELKNQIEDLAQQHGTALWLNNKAFCNLLGISSRTAQNYRDRGMITFSQIGPKIYYQKEDIEAFLERYKVKAFYSKSA